MTAKQKPQPLSLSELSGAAANLSGVVGGVATGGGEGGDVDHAIKEKRLQAAGIEVAQLEGAVVPVDAMESALRMLSGEISNKVRACGNKLGAKVARESDPAKCREIINTETDDLLSALRAIDVSAIAQAAAEETRVQRHRRVVRK